MVDDIYFACFLRYTTVAYRSPEMVDLYAGHIIDTKSDVWVNNILKRITTLNLSLQYFKDYKAPLLQSTSVIPPFLFGLFLGSRLSFVQTLLLYISFW